MYDCVLFDLDGTLTDSAEGIINCVDYALTKMGREPLEPDKRRLYIGPPLYDSFQRINGFSEEEAHECVRIYRERFSVIGWKENRVYTGIARLLRSLKQNGVYTAIASAKPETFTRYVADYFGLSKYLDCLSAAPMNYSGMPKSEIIRNALPEGARCPVMVGDRLYDIEGAKGAGIKSIGVTYGYGTEEELLEAGADVICRSVDELTDELMCGRALAPGKCLTFEGIDSSGKTTQMKRAGEWLTQCGWQVTYTREPGGTPLGENIRNLLLNTATGEMTPECEALLFAASRAQHTEYVLRPARARGEIVMCDRYLDSSIAFQGGGRGLGEEEVREINRYAVKDFAPDMTLYYDISPEIARTRRESDDRIEREQNDFHQRVRETYLAIARREPERVKVFDGTLDRDTLAEQTKAAIESII